MGAVRDLGRNTKATPSADAAQASDRWTVRFLAGRPSLGPTLLCFAFSAEEQPSLDSGPTTDAAMSATCAATRACAPLAPRVLASTSRRRRIRPWERARGRAHCRRCLAAAATDAASDGGERGLALYNSMSRKKEPFLPRPSADAVTTYVCGVTVYDLSHIGHSRVYTVFDVLFRHLKRLGHKVIYCRNFTDVDDKIIKRANEAGVSCDDLTSRYIDAFHEDMRVLGCLEPTLEPRATEYVGAMIDQIERIIDNGHGYVASAASDADAGADADVFFSVPSLASYGALSGRKLDDNRAGERVAVDGRKRHPADFALWKAKKPDEPSWPSPWGEGRPGWHIECSAMIHDLLGDVVDIHGGGRDLCFPHHENELAQSVAANGAGAGCCQEVRARPPDSPPPSHSLSLSLPFPSQRSRTALGDGTGHPRSPLTRVFPSSAFRAPLSLSLSLSLSACVVCWLVVGCWCMLVDVVVCMCCWLLVVVVVGCWYGCVGCWWLVLCCVVLWCCE